MRDRVAALENIVYLTIWFAVRKLPFVVASAHILWTKQAQYIQWTQGIFMPFSSCHFPSNTKYSILTLCARAGQPVRDQQPHLLCYRKDPLHTRGHT